MYDPGGTPRNVNAPFRSVMVAAVSSPLSVLESSTSDVGNNRNAWSATESGGPINRPEMRHVVVARRWTSAPLRVSPDSMGIDAACRAVGASPLYVVGNTAGRLLPRADAPAGLSESAVLCRTKRPASGANVVPDRGTMPATASAFLTAAASAPEPAASAATPAGSVVCTDGTTMT